MQGYEEGIFYDGELIETGFHQDMIAIERNSHGGKSDLLGDYDAVNRPWNATSIAKQEAQVLAPF